MVSHQAADDEQERQEQEDRANAELRHRVLTTDQLATLKFTGEALGHPADIGASCCYHTGLSRDARHEEQVGRAAQSRSEQMLPKRDITGGRALLAVR